MSENKYIRFLKKVKINLLDTPDIAKRIEKDEFFSQDEQLDKRAILLEKGNTINLDDLYRLCFKIFNNLINFYEKEFLVRITFEIAKLYGYIATFYSGFNP